MIPVRQSTAVEISIGPVLDADGVAFTGAIVGDFQVKKNGADWAALNGSATATHTAVGNYDLVLTTSDVDTVGIAAIRISDTVNACATIYLQVVEEVIYDAFYAASANTFTGAAGSNAVRLVDLATTTTTATNVTTVNGLAANVITATSIAADAITDAKVASDVTIASVTGAVGSVTGNVGGIAGTITTLDALDTAQDLEHDATQAAIAGIGTAGGAAINVDATTDNAAGGITGVTSGTVKVGTETGTFANASFVDASYHLITHATNAIDWVYQFLTGGGTNVVSATWTGYLDGSNDTVTFYAWNHSGAAWESIGTQAGQAGSTNVVKTLTLFARHRGTSAAELGKVYIRIACTGMTSPVLRTDALSVSYSVTSRSVGYANGEVWIDTVAGTAGTESFVNGVADNPALTLADALTIATANKLTQFNVANGSTITLGGATTTKRFEGHEWILDLNTQNISGTNFEGANAVTGVSSGTTDVQFEDCVIGNGSTGATLPPGTYIRCGFNTGSGFAFTGSAAGRYVFVDCYSNIAAGGASTPYFVFTGASTVMFRRYSGGANITFDAATAALTYECLGGGGLTVALAGSDIEMRGIIRDVTLTGITAASTVRFVGTTGAITLGGADGTANIYGVVGTVTDNRTGSPTLTNTANLDTDLGSLITTIGTAGAGLTNIDLPDQTMNITGNITGNLSGSVGSVAGAVGSVTGDVGSVTGNVGGNVVGSVASVTGNVTGSVGSIATGGIAAASFAAGAIDAAAIAADAIGASELAADAVAEIQSGLATAANLATVAGYLDTEIAAILADTNELQTDWANGGRLDLLIDALTPGAATNVSTSGQNISSAEL